MDNCRQCKYCKISVIDTRFDNCYHPESDSKFADIAVKIGNCGPSRRFFEKRVSFFPKIIWSDLASAIIGRLIGLSIITGGLALLWYYLK